MSSSRTRRPRISNPPKNAFSFFHTVLLMRARPRPPRRRSAAARGRRPRAAPDGGAEGRSKTFLSLPGGRNTGPAGGKAKTQLLCPKERQRAFLCPGKCLGPPRFGAARVPFCHPFVRWVSPSRRVRSTSASFSLVSSRWRRSSRSASSSWPVTTAWAISRCSTMDSSNRCRSMRE